MEYVYKGRKVWYEVSGEGAPVIFLHGWGCTHSVFDPFVGTLAVQYSVFALDFPGFGGSEEPDEVWGVEEYTAMLEAFCDDLHLEPPALIGHSFGGRVSILYASRRPVSRVVLTDAAGIKPRRSIGYYAKVYSYKTVKWVLLKLLRRPDLLERYRAGKGSSDYNSASPRMKAVLSKVVNEDLKSVMPLIKAPVLLFWGDRDTATPISDARTMERLMPDAGLVTVPGGTHFSFLEAPGLYASVLRSFFDIRQDGR